MVKILVGQGWSNISTLILKYQQEYLLEFSVIFKDVVCSCIQKQERWAH